jgi:hypothetical protein
MTPDDRRREPRTKVWIHTQLHPPKAPPADAVTVEVSVGGLRIQSKTAVSPQSRISVTLDVGSTFEFQGIVQWLLDTFDRGQQIYQMGMLTDTIITPHTTARTVSERAAALKQLLAAMTPTS